MVEEDGCCAYFDGGEGIAVMITIRFWGKRGGIG
jgi:hypothetical protein